MNVCIHCGDETERAEGPLIGCYQCGHVGTLRRPSVAVRELLARIERLKNINGDRLHAGFVDIVKKEGA